MQGSHVWQVDEGDVEAEHAEHVADGDQEEERLTEDLVVDHLLEDVHQRTHVFVLVGEDTLDDAGPAEVSRDGEVTCNNRSSVDHRESGGRSRPRGRKFWDRNDGVTVAGDCRLGRNGGETRHRVLRKIYNDKNCSVGFFLQNHSNAFITLNLLDF